MNMDFLTLAIIEGLFTLANPLWMILGFLFIGVMSFIFGVLYKDHRVGTLLGMGIWVIIAFLIGIIKTNMKLERVTQVAEAIKSEKPVVCYKSNEKILIEKPKFLNEKQIVSSNKEVFDLWNCEIANIEILGTEENRG